MRRMTDLERTLHHTVEHNSLLFLEEGVKEIDGQMPYIEEIQPQPRNL